MQTCQYPISGSSLGAGICFLLLHLVSMNNYLKFLILFSLLIPTNSFSCICKKNRPIKEEYKRVATVISGKIIAITNFTLKANPNKTKKYDISKLPSLVKKTKGKKYTVKLENVFKVSLKTV